MLFDHGCDAFAVTLVILPATKFLLMGNSIYTVIWFSLCIAMFHLTILEEYYVGSMVLGHCNPISDLSIGVYALFTFLGFYGNEFTQNIMFKQNELYQGSSPLRYTDVLMIVTFLI